VVEEGREVRDRRRFVGGTPHFGARAFEKAP
jgi:hypothetical protein